MNTPKIRKHSFILMFALLACGCYFIIMWVHLQMDIKERRANFEDVSLQYQQQVEENKKLEKQINDGISEEEMERIAREELGYVFPGEHVYADASSSK